MSATINEDAAKSVANQPGEVGSHVPRDGPFETKGHQPGRLTGNDAVPEHQVEAHPPGTAPANKTHIPQPDDVPGQTNNPAAGGSEGEGVGTSASATLGGATSADVHTGLGRSTGLSGIALIQAAAATVLVGSIWVFCLYVIFMIFRTPGWWHDVK